MIDVLHDHIADLQEFSSGIHTSADIELDCAAFFEAAKTAQECGFSRAVLSGKCGDGAARNVKLRYS